MAAPVPPGDSLASRSVADLPARDSLADRSIADRSAIELARLLEHPAIWRGRSAARAEALATGYGALDACLPGKGWPRTGLIEILVSRFGIGELHLLLPMLAALTGRPMARWCVWIAPPLEPYAPALAAHGVTLERILVVRAPEPLWAFEQTLASGASDISLAWAARGPRTREIRRLQLAAERGKALGVLFRPRRAARESSPAVLRLAVEPRSTGMRLTLLKSRGGARGSIELTGWPTGS
jgi:cell division inhibitor SulA/protein ImuA